MGNPKRSKSYGYETEVAAVDALRQLFPDLHRTGSVAYKKSAADLVQLGATQAPALNLVVTRDKHRPLVVSMSAADLIAIVLTAQYGDLNTSSVRVQVKGRARTWVGTLLDQLRKSM